MRAGIQEVPASPTGARPAESQARAEACVSCASESECVVCVCVCVCVCVVLWGLSPWGRGSGDRGGGQWQVRAASGRTGGGGRCLQ